MTRLIALLVAFVARGCRMITSESDEVLAKHRISLKLETIGKPLLRILFFSCRPSRMASHSYPSQR